MSASSRANVLLCPGCGYDVAQTIADGIGVCPECGGRVSKALCRRIPTGARRTLDVLVFMPLVGFVLGLPIGWGVSRASGAQAWWVKLGPSLLLAVGALTVVYCVGHRVARRDAPGRERMRSTEIVIATVIANVGLAMIGVLLLSIVASLAGVGWP